MTRANPPGSARLQYRGHPADRECGEHRPRQIRLARTRRPHRDRRDQDDGGDGEYGDLEAEPEGERPPAAARPVGGAGRRNRRNRRHS